MLLLTAEGFSTASIPTSFALAITVQGDAGLPLIDPFWVNNQVVVHENATPSAAELLKCLAGPVRGDHEKGSRRVGHQPQPVELATTVAGRVVDVDYLAADCRIRTGKHAEIQ